VAATCWAVSDFAPVLPDVFSRSDSGASTVVSGVPEDFGDDSLGSDVEVTPPMLPATGGGTDSADVDASAVASARDALWSSALLDFFFFFFLPFIGAFAGESTGSATESGMSVLVFGVASLFSPCSAVLVGAGVDVESEFELEVMFSGAGLDVTVGLGAGAGVAAMFEDAVLREAMFGELVVFGVALELVPVVAAPVFAAAVTLGPGFGVTLRLAPVLAAVVFGPGVAVVPSGVAVGAVSGVALSVVSAFVALVGVLRPASVSPFVVIGPTLDAALTPPDRLAFAPLTGVGVTVFGVGPAGLFRVVAVPVVGEAFVMAPLFCGPWAVAFDGPSRPVAAESVEVWMPGWPTFCSWPVVTCVSGAPTGLRALFGTDVFVAGP
jgi:hypothetical protein